MRFRTSRWSERRWVRVGMVLGFLAAATAAVCWGRNSSLLRVTAAPPLAQGQTAANREQPQPAVAPTGNYSDRVVGYIYGSTPVTREQLADYLIERFGAEKVELLVNKLIIEHECRQAGVEVTAAEVEAAFDDDLKHINVNREQFVKQVLKQRKVTEYEWKQDVIRPRLMLTKLCRTRVQVTEDDLQKIYEAYHGEKVHCQMIMWPKNEERIARKMWEEEIRKSDEAFDRAAVSQASNSLASGKGMLDPFGRNATGNEQLEREAFRLRPGEVSAIIGTPDGYVVLKLIKKIPPDGVKLADCRAQLEREIIDKKTQEEIPKVFKEMRDRAKPVVFLKKSRAEEELVRAWQKNPGGNAGAATTPAQAPPQGH